MAQANILINAAGNAQIVDFDNSTIAGDFENPGVGRSTPQFTAPEILKGFAPHSKKSDVFAFGMVMIEVGGG